MALATAVAVLSSVAAALVLSDAPVRTPTTLVAGGLVEGTTTSVRTPVTSAEDTSRVRLPRVEEPVGHPAEVEAAPTTTTSPAPAIASAAVGEGVTVQPEQCDPRAPSMPAGVDLLAYATGDGLRLRSLDGRIDLPVPGPAATDLRVGDAVWEPNGTRVAYVAKRSVPPSSAVVVTDAVTACSWAVSPVRSGQHDQPGWSTDGRVGFRSTGGDDVGIDVADPRQPRSPAVRLLSGASTGPVWAPDRTGRVAYLDRDGLRLFDPATGAARLLHRRLDAGAPVWSPDATRLAFTVTVDPGVWLVRADGGEARRVSPPGVSPVSPPTWSPDGSRLAFVATTLPRLAADVWIVDADGARPVQVTTTGTASGSVLWSPDGRLLAYAAGVDPSVELLDLVTLERRTLVAGARPVAFARRPSGR